MAAVLRAPGHGTSRRGRADHSADIGRVAQSTEWRPHHERWRWLLHWLRFKRGRTQRTAGLTPATLSLNEFLLGHRFTIAMQASSRHPSLGVCAGTAVIA